jgi:hypothetical protein
VRKKIIQDLDVAIAFSCFIFFHQPGKCAVLPGIEILYLLKTAEMLEVVVFKSTSDPDVTFEFQISIAPESCPFTAEMDIIKAVSPPELIACAKTDIFLSDNL